MAECVELVADCRLRAATDLFVHRWDPVLLAALGTGAQRRSELLAAVGGISDKVLTEALRRLLTNGLVARTRRGGAPPRVDYALTPLGASLVAGPLRELGRWILTHGDELLDAQVRSASRA